MNETATSGFVVSGKFPLDIFSFSLDRAAGWVRKIFPERRLADLPQRNIRDEAPPAVQKTYDFVLWLVKKVENFPRSYRFTVGDRLTITGLELLTTLVEAAYSRRKEPLLETAGQKVNAIRFLLRLAKDLQLLPVESYGFCAESLDEIGRMVGGWRKSSAGRPA